ncbi:Uncharacterised protein [Flavonifractor plautii]|uniref:Uncharacterized protein n=1 Tax=Flavonifractor plautii TaxID=292800 RepID=A0A174UGU6_FLAPL|nr:Uncharacterised protein [Flavonifractor plautii]
MEVFKCLKNSRTALPRWSTSTAALRSRCWRAWRPSASAPACISAPRRRAACTTWCTRSWTTPSTRPWPATATRLPSRSERGTSSPSSTTAAAFPWISSPRPACPPWRWCSRSSTPAANSAAAAIRCPAASTAWAPAWSTPCPSGWKCGFTRRARSTR